MAFFEELVGKSRARHFVLLRKLSPADAEHYEVPLSENSSDVADDSKPGAVANGPSMRMRTPRSPKLSNRNVYCLFDFVPTAIDEVGLRAGDRVEVMDTQDADGWVQVRGHVSVSFSRSFGFFVIAPGQMLIEWLQWDCRYGS